MNEAGGSLLRNLKGGRLAEAMREVRDIAAEREDVVSDIREASRSLLELLAVELEPVFAEVPADDPSFDFVISNGEQPRLWIDAVAHVALGRDRRTYRFVRDTRMGRVVLVESADVKTVAERVTLYIAERMVQRQRMIEGDVEPVVKRRDPSADTDGPWENAWKSLLALLLGAVIGASLVLLVLKGQVLERILQAL